jgi:hypothetical protein
MKAHVFLFGVFMVATAIAAERWRSPDKFYSIVPPADWRHSESKTTAGSSYAFTSPETDSQKFASQPLTISTYPMFCQKTY